VAVNDSGDGVLVQSAIPGALGVNHHDRTQVAGVQASGASRQNVPGAPVQAFFLQAHSQPGADLGCTGCGASGALTEQHVMGVRRDNRPTGVGRPGMAAAGSNGGIGIQGQSNGLRGGAGHLGPVVEEASKKDTQWCG